MAQKGTGVTAVDRALSLLNAFEVHDSSLGLSDLAERTGLYKSTVLRLLDSLIRNGCIHQLGDGSYQLGSRLFHWGSIYQSSLRMDDHIPPVLRRVVAETGEGAAFFKREGKVRVCLFAEHSPRSVRIDLRPGDVLPLGIGAGGRVLQLFDPSQKKKPASLVIVSLGEREPEIGGVAVPVFGPAGSLYGSLAIVAPVFRLTEDALQVISKSLMKGAIELTKIIGGDLTRLNARPKEVDHSD